MLRKLFSVITVSFLMFSPMISFSQTETGIVITSESKQIFKEINRLIEIADDVYHNHAEEISKKSLEMIRKEIKSRTDQSTRNELVQPGLETHTEIKEEEGRISLMYIIKINNFNFRITTPDVVPGIGLDKSLDPKVFGSYEAVASFPLFQDGTAESIRFGNPSWSINTYNLETFSLKHIGVNEEDVKSQLQYMLDKNFTSLYVELNEITGKFNDYLDKQIKKNPLLLKEFEIDENRQLIVKPDATFTNFVFQHNYSKTGYIKRNSGTDASVIAESTKSTQQTIPGTTTEAGVILKGPSGTKPGNKVITIPGKKNQ